MSMTLKDKIEDEIKDAEIAMKCWRDKLCDGIDDPEKTPCHAMIWSLDAFKAAGTIEALKVYAIAYAEGHISDSKTEESVIVDKLRYRMASRATTIEQSTSLTSNLVERYALAAIGRVLDWNRYKF